MGNSFAHADRETNNDCRIRNRISKKTCPSYEDGILYGDHIYIVSSKKMHRLTLKVVTILCVCGGVALSLYPVNRKLYNFIFVCCLIGFWLGFLLLVWKRKYFRLVTILVVVLAAIPFILPSKSIDPNRLREGYLDRLIKLNGTTYVWGGENRWGIDCSGLPRKALRGALLAYGLKNLNGTAMRSFAENWWYDASARALGEGYRDYTVVLEPKGTVKEMDYSSLLPGDLAITENGIHVLVYLGKNEWIQAAPELGKVAIMNGREDKNSWLTVPVKTYRWNLLNKKNG